ncbi:MULTISPECIES: DUF1835 domain-containing protein [Paenibacillus]|uniref:DUF1835 domain-containing protein n=1 Tax=Paenibacillus amylolyticus TaxID=1451 RepID=A0ABD8AT30_PAEAM|nr:DUF1835 domain-containing protein [Paenibacillus amylolyticus]WFA84376.1 DUF1835 domain-containing protein [Paenibacillus amylolyticus]
MNDNIYAFSRTINRMSEDELRSVLRVLYMKSAQVVKRQEEQGEKVDFAEAVQSLFRNMDIPFDLGRLEQQALSEVDKPNEIHITFGESPLSSLKMGMSTLPDQEKRSFFSIDDNYAVGPLGDLTRRADLQRRHLWLTERMCLNDREAYGMHELESLFELNATIQSFDSKTSIIIWYANNAREKTGLLYAMYLLRNTESPIYLIETSGLYKQLFDRPDVQYDVLHTGEILPEKLLAMWHVCSEQEPLSKGERRQLEQDWLELSVQPGLLRMMENGVIRSLTEDALDEYIMQKVRELTPNWEPGKYIRAARIVGEVIGTSSQHISDAFVEYRLRQLVLQGQLEMDGKPLAMRYYSIRLAER